jgi:hypothetical protein
MKKLFFALLALVGFSFATQASDSGCSLTLVVFRSPYVNSPTNLFSCATCDATVGIGHYPPNPSDAPNADGNMELLINDGDLIDIAWPTCCTTGWGIMAEGAVVTIDHGNVAVTSRVTLSIPNSFGILPYPTISYPPYPTNGITAPMLPPFTTLALPPSSGYPGPNQGYYGGIWIAHVHCACDLPPGQVRCDVSFELKALLSGPNPAWVMNQGAPVINVIYDLYPFGFGHPDFWCSHRNPIDYPPIITTSSGLQYQWLPF